MIVVLKEANESEDWIRLLYRTEYLTDEEYNSIEKDAKELIAILVSICKNKQLILHFALCILHYLSEINYGLV